MYNEGKHSDGIHPTNDVSIHLSELEDVVEKATIGKGIPKNSTLWCVHSSMISLWDMVNCIIGGRITQAGNTEEVCNGFSWPLGINSFINSYFSTDNTNRLNVRFPWFPITNPFSVSLTSACAQPPYPISGIQTVESSVVDWSDMEVSRIVPKHSSTSKGWNDNTRVVSSAALSVSNDELTNENTDEGVSPSSLQIRMLIRRHSLEQFRITSELCLTPFNSTQPKAQTGDLANSKDFSRSEWTNQILPSCVTMRCLPFGWRE